MGGRKKRDKEEAEWCQKIVGKKVEERKERLSENRARESVV